MLGNILFQILMFIIIWDIYLRIGGQNTNLKNRILYLLFDVALCILGTTHWTLYRHSTSLSSHCNIDI